MKKTLLALLILLSLVLNNNIVSALDETRSITVDNKERSFLVHLPEGYNDSEKSPVVLLFHGGGGTGEGAAESYKMNELADKKGFIVVYPNGTGKLKNWLLTWNAGVCCGSAKKNNVDDVKFINNLIKYLENTYNVDPKRIYATGMSNGAGFSYRLACELSDKIAAIAPVGGQIMIDKCNPKRAIPVLHIHGDKDNCANYDGGHCGGCFQSFLNLKKNTWPCISVEDTFTKFGKLNKCSEEAKVIKNNKDVICKQFQNCKDNSETTLCTIKDGGHTWPGKVNEIKACIDRPEGYICKKWKETMGNQNTSVNANKMIWDFFSKHSLP